jgi:hypothetical protein
MSEVAWRVDEFGETQYSGVTVAGRTAAFSIPRTNIFAGIVGGATVVTIADQWTPVGVTPSPFLGYTYIGGVIEILLSKTYGDWGYGQNLGEGLGACEGLLILTVTADGQDCENTLVIAFSDASNNYNATALGYGVGLPSDRWTNIRQAVET